MEVGGNGGFSGFRRFPQPNSGMMRVADVSMGQQASKVNHNSSSSSSASAAEVDGECTVREQDRFMPIANVIRIMRKILPTHAKISDDAKETIQECVSEYISFITGEANERCQREQRKTITAEDVLWAMSKLGFDDYIEPLTLYLHRYREFDGGERGGSLRGGGDPLGKRSTSVDHHQHPAAAAATSLGIAPYPPPHFHYAHHHPAPGFFTNNAHVHPMTNGFLKDIPPSSTNGGGGGGGASSHAALANGQHPFDQSKE